MGGPFEHLSLYLFAHQEIGYRVGRRSGTLVCSSDPSASDPYSGSTLVI